MWTMGYVGRHADLSDSTPPPRASHASPGGVESDGSAVYAEVWAALEAEAELREREAAS